MFFVDLMSPLDQDAALVFTLAGFKYLKQIFDADPFSVTEWTSRLFAV